MNIDRTLVRYKMLAKMVLWDIGTLVHGTLVFWDGM